MAAGARIGIALGVAAALGLLWWAFDSAPPGSWRARFDRWGRTRAERNLARGLRRPSFIGFAVTSVLIVIFLVWSAR